MAEKKQKKSINDVMGMQSKGKKTATDTVKGSEGGTRKSPRITVTIGRETYDVLHAEMEKQKDLGRKGSMSQFVDDAIRKALELDS